MSLKAYKRIKSLLKRLHDSKTNTCICCHSFTIENLGAKSTATSTALSIAGSGCY